jgi:hypothetical protein
MAEQRNPSQGPPDRNQNQGGQSPEQTGRGQEQGEGRRNSNQQNQKERTRGQGRTSDRPSGNRDNAS